MGPRLFEENISESRSRISPSLISPQVIAHPLFVNLIRAALPDENFVQRRSK
jgi:hypothetical protein